MKLLSIFLVVLCSIANASELDLDWHTIEKEWSFIKKSTGAPADLPMPPIEIDSTLPSAARMVFQFPTVDDMQTEVKILINPRVLSEFNVELLDWGIGHELTHYAFVMRENDWDINRSHYQITIKHHCNKEFMRITSDIADIIDARYHSEKYRMLSEVQRSCAFYPNQ